MIGRGLSSEKPPILELPEIGQLFESGQNKVKTSKSDSTRHGETNGDNFRSQKSFILELPEVNRLDYLVMIFRG